jgi:hypothetical protein
MDALPYEILYAILNGTDRHGKSILDPRWRFTAREVCARWR